MTNNIAFPFVPLDPRRSLEKPRKSGMTMVSDYQLGPSGLKDLLVVGGDFIDIFKFATGTSRLLPRDLLIEKLAMLRDANIRPFLGGQFQEYVLHNLGIDAFDQHLAEAKAVGFDMVEISDNVVDVDEETKLMLLNKVKEYGLSPVGEIGDKTAHTSNEDMVAEIQQVLNSGAELAMVEGQELMLDGEPNIALIELIKQNIDTTRVMFELATPRVGSTHAEIYKGKKFLIKTFGPDVNLGNVTPETVVETETTRLGLGSAGPLNLM